MTKSLFPDRLSFFYECKQSENQKHGLPHTVAMSQWNIIFNEDQVSSLIVWELDLVVDWLGLSEMRDGGGLGTGKIRELLVSIDMIIEKSGRSVGSSWTHRRAMWMHLVTSSL